MWKSLLAGLALCLGASGCVQGAGAQQAQPTFAAAPEFKSIDRWFNSRPLSMAGLKGKVVLVEFWTFDCINCLHVMPHVKQWHARYQDQGLTIVGVHTPELPEEYDRAHLQDAIRRYGIAYPVAQDNSYATWNAYGNRYWPAMYLIDKEGRIVYRHFGEGDYEATESRIRQLLSAH